MAAPAPGGIPLRPLGLGDILNGAVTSARRNPAATFGLAAIVMTLNGLLTAVFEAIERTQAHRLTSTQQALQNGQSLSQQQVDSMLRSVFGVLLPSVLATVVLTLVLTSALTGMLSVVIGRGVLGRKVSLGEAWRAARLGAVVATSLLLLLIAICVPLPVVVVAVLLALLHLGPVAVIIAVVGGIASVVFEILLAVRLSLALPALMLERISPWNAIKRSWELSRGSFWRLFGILLLTEIIVGIAAALLSLPFGIIGSIVGGGHDQLVQRRRDGLDRRRHHCRNRQHRRQHDHQADQRRRHRAAVRRPADAPRGPGPGAAQRRGGPDPDRAGVRHRLAPRRPARPDRLGRDCTDAR